MRWLAVNPYSSEYGSCDVPIVQEVGEGARLVVSEPFGRLPGAWVEVPGATYGIVGIVGSDGDQLMPFAPQAPPKVR